VDPDPALNVIADLDPAKISTRILAPPNKDHSNTVQKWIKIITGIALGKTTGLYLGGGGHQWMHQIYVF
jgi:hypothetical protein